MWLVDSSAWIEFLRSPRRLTLEDLADDPSQIVTCLPVIQEVLQGLDDERVYSAIRTSMLSWRCVDSPLPQRVFERAVGLYRQTRRTGVTIRSSVDCLIAASALSHGLTVVHCDRDFPAIAKVSGLQQVDLRPRLRRLDA